MKADGRGLLEGWRGAGRRTIHEGDAKRLLRRWGVAVPGAPDDAPAAVKLVADDLPHKSDRGLVRLAVPPEDVARTAEELRALHAGGEVLVERMIEDGVGEWIVGCKVDPTFGPVVAVGPGGVLAELVDDVCVRLAPLSRADAAAAAARGVGGRLLAGYRGGAEGDLDALAALIHRLSEAFAENADLISEIEINPVIVRPRGEGAVAADALVVMKAPS